MCGGRANRMRKQAGEEKPLLKVDGTAMIEYVISALSNSEKFDRIVGTVSPNAPKTWELLKSMGIETMETSGQGYSQDLSRLLSILEPHKVLVVPADIPLLNSQIVIEIFSTASNVQEPAISLILEKRFVEGLGVRPSIVFDQYCYSGITMFNTIALGSIPVQEHYLVMNRREIALNVNTREDLELAKKLLV